MSTSGDCCVVPGASSKNPELVQNGTKMEDKVSEEKVNGATNVTEDKLDLLMPQPLNAAGTLANDTNSRSSTPSEGNTPREYDTSSGSPSPVPEDGSEVPRRKINLGRDISLMMQALNSLNSPEEKIAALCKKYADLLEQQKTKDKRARALERKVAQAAKENEELQKEVNKALLGKTKMESLARELNKQNKLLKEETFNLTVSHNTEREQVSAKFQAATDEISGKINAIADRNELLNDQNKEMSEKITKLVEETVSREKMFKTMMEQRDIQEKILELKAKKAEEERDLALEAQEFLKKDVEKTTMLCEGYMKQEVALKAQITFYSEKVADFQSTLDKSNKVFTTFRGEMDAMNTKMKSLEKASATWKKNYEKCESENERLVAETMKQAAQNNQLNIKVTRLTNLSRALQAERNDLAGKVKACQNLDTSSEVTSTVGPPECNSDPHPSQESSSDLRTGQPSPQVRGQPQGRESPDSSSQATLPSKTQSSHTPIPGNVSAPTSDEMESSQSVQKGGQQSITPADSSSNVKTPSSSEISSTTPEDEQ